MQGIRYYFNSVNGNIEIKKCNNNEWKFRMIYIDREWFRNAFGSNSERICFSCMKVNKDMCLDIKEVFDDFQNNIVSIENESKLLNYISVLMNMNSKNVSNEIVEMVNIEKIKAVKRFLEENYLCDIMINDLTKIANISKYYLIRQFTDCYGISPHKYIINLRINHAKKLLKGSINFVEVALESGFYDQSHFIKAFKEYTGVTPMKYIS